MPGMKEGKIDLVFATNILENCKSEKAVVLMESAKKELKKLEEQLIKIDEDHTNDLSEIVNDGARLIESKAVLKSLKPYTLAGLEPSS